MIGRTILHPLEEALLKITRQDSISDEDLVKILKIIKSISKVNNLRQVERKLCTKILTSIPSFNNRNLKKVLPTEINIDAVDSECNTALYHAILRNHTKVVLELIKAKANLHHFNGKINLICVAAANNHVEILTWLIDAKARVDQLPPNIIASDSALNLAVHNNCFEAMQLLLAANADANLQPHGWETALMWASHLGRREMAEMLISKANAKLELVNHMNRTALDEAVSGNKISTISLLLKFGAHISDPKDLYHSIKISDQRDPDVVAALECLLKRLSELPKLSDLTKPQQFSNTDISQLMKAIEIHLKKLRNLYYYHEKNVYHLIDAATTQSIPSPVLMLINSYDTPLARLSFFTADKLSKLIPGELDHAQTKEFKCDV